MQNPFLLGKIGRRKVTKVEQARGKGKTGYIRMVEKRPSDAKREKSFAKEETLKDGGGTEISAEAQRKEETWRGGGI